MKKHILVIDDDEDDLTLLVEAFNRLNILHKCTWAKSTEHALKQLQYLTPDIIFLDVNMPGADGLQCLRAIKQMPAHNHIPVILQSTAMDERLQQQGLLLGATSCMRKPDTMEQLDKTLQLLFTTVWADVEMNR